MPLEVVRFTDGGTRYETWGTLKGVRTRKQRLLTPSDPPQRLLTPSDPPKGS